MSIFWACFCELSVQPCRHLCSKHIRTKYMYYSLVCCHRQDFRCLHQERKLTWGGFLSPLTMQIADLSWRNTRVPVPLISCSTHSSKLPSWLSTPSIDCEEQRKQCMHMTNRIFEQTPSPHIYLKEVCRKGLEAYFCELMVHLHAIINRSHRVCWWQLSYTHTNRCVYVRTHWKHSVRLRVLVSVP